MWKIFQSSESLIPEAEALKGREQPIISDLDAHLTLGNTCLPPFPEKYEIAVFGLGCFWGAERAFWKVPGVYTTMVGYAGGYTPNPSYREVCSGQTGHAEVVRVVYDPEVVSFQSLLALFWESHDPTQGFRQGNDRGSQYRSLIIAATEEQAEQAKKSLERYQSELENNDVKADITTELLSTTTRPSKRLEFYYAETEHQQYLAKNPNGYCGLGGVGIKFPNH